MSSYPGGPGIPDQGTPKTKTTCVQGHRIWWRTQSQNKFHTTRGCSHEAILASSQTITLPRRTRLRARQRQPVRSSRCWPCCVPPSLWMTDTESRTTHGPSGRAGSGTFWFCSCCRSSRRAFGEQCLLVCLAPGGSRSPGTMALGATRHHLTLPGATWHH